MDLTPAARCLALLLVAALLAGCTAGTDNATTTQSIAPVESNPHGFAAWTDAIPAYRFAAGDHIKVQFLLTPEMGEETVVAPDGVIGLRAAGQVLASGLTAPELQTAITRASKLTLADPIVTASLVESPGAKVFVGGSVARPGAFPVDGQHGPLEAVMLAGGFTPDARMDQVVLIRRSPKNQPMLRTVDLRSFASLGAAEGDLPLVPGDIVFVPRNRISEVDLWIDQFINRLLPFSKAFNYTVNRNPGMGQLF
jgi:protein involved in polysaccharide export with SLBB domain